MAKWVVGDDEDRNVFVRATEVMRREGASYRVRFVVHTEHHDDHSTTSGMLDASSPGLGIIEAEGPPSARSVSSMDRDSDRGSFHDSEHDTDLDDQSYDMQCDNDHGDHGYDNKSDGRDGDGDVEISSLGRSASLAPSDATNPNDNDDMLLELEGQGIIISEGGEPSHVSFSQMIPSLWQSRGSSSKDEAPVLFPGYYSWQLLFGYEMG